MKEIPLICSTPMVQAILQRTKNQIRRLKNLNAVNAAPDDWDFIGFVNKDFNEYFKNGLWAIFRNKSDKDLDVLLRSPFGEKGDLLWVRESYWRHIDTPKDHSGIVPGENCFYSASVNENKEWLKGWYRKKPSIHMPKAASRIWLQNVVDPYPERLQDISSEDAIYEGVNRKSNTSDSEEYIYKDYIHDGFYNLSPTGSFRTLWEKINGKESWGLNPWVWVIKFRELSRDGKPEMIDQKNAARKLLKRLKAMK